MQSMECRECEGSGQVELEDEHGTPRALAECAACLGYGQLDACEGCESEPMARGFSPLCGGCAKSCIGCEQGTREHGTPGCSWCTEQAAQDEAAHEAAHGPEVAR